MGREENLHETSVNMISHFITCLNVISFNGNSIDLIWKFWKIQHDFMWNCQNYVNWNWTQIHKNSRMYFGSPLLSFFFISWLQIEKEKSGRWRKSPPAASEVLASASTSSPAFRRNRILKPTWFSILCLEWILPKATQSQLFVELYTVLQCSRAMLTMNSVHRNIVFETLDLVWIHHSWVILPLNEASWFKNQNLW